MLDGGILCREQSTFDTVVATEVLSDGAVYQLRQRPDLGEVEVSSQELSNPFYNFEVTS